MIKTIDMKLMRYLNLFSKISKVTPKHCFVYNNILIFTVNEKNLSKAIGENGENIKKISEILNKKVRVVMIPKSLGDAEKFISTIIYPIQIKSVEIDGQFLIINSGQQNKALLIGRNKQRFKEMRKIVKDYFDKDLKIA
ncbi:MAG: KH domain-containing protein [Candidatus Pacearchaeota archaeon]